MTDHRQPDSPTSAGKPSQAGVHGAIRVVLIYAVFAALWILLSDQLLGVLFRDPDEFALASTVKGWAFVAVTSLLLFFLLRRLVRQQMAGSLGREHGHRIDEAETTADRPDSSKSSTLHAGLLSLLILAVTGGFIVDVVRDHRHTEVARLQVIADFKSRQIGDWFTERHGDATYLHTSTLLSTLYSEWRSAGKLASRDILQRRLGDFRAAKTYHSLLLLDEQGALL